MTSISTSIIYTRPDRMPSKTGTMSTDVQEIPSTAPDAGNYYVYCSNYGNLNENCIFRR